MKRIIALFLFIGMYAPGVRAQEFLNGDFEINSAIPGNNYTNISNTAFNDFLPFCHAFAPLTNGMTGSLDLLTGPSAWDMPFSGERFVGIVPYPYDIFTMELSEALVPGGMYRISFYQRNYGIAEPLDIGLSTVNNGFGDLIGVAPVSVSPPGVWENYTFEFEAPDNGRFICLRMGPQPGMGAWTVVDHFTIDPVPCEPVLDLGPDRTLCSGQSLLLQPQGTPFTGYVWSDQSVGTTLTVTQPGTYWVIGTRGTCSDSDTVVISPGEIPEAVFQADRTEGCSPLAVTFAYTGHAQPGYTYTWTAGDGTEPLSGEPFTHVYTQAQCHNVSLRVTNAQGCTVMRTLADYVCVHPAPHAAFTHTPEPVFADHPQVQFVNASAGHAAVEWEFGDGSASSEENPLHTYALGQGADYPVRLTVTSDIGCTDTAWDTVRVRYPFDLFVPDAFTPDGDGANPVFLPVVAAPFDVEEYRLQIFDRWGTTLFSTEAISQGWNGTVNGRAAPVGTYVWKISVRDPYTHRGITRTGHLLLLK